MKTKTLNCINMPLAALFLCFLTGACNGTTITTKTYRTDGSLESETVSESSETSFSAISRAFSENSKEKLRLVWLDASKFSFGCSVPEASLGADYFEANGGYLSMPMSAQNKVSYAELLAVSKIASSTKFSGGLSYGDFNMQANPSANENGGISDSAQTQEEKE